MVFYSKRLKILLTHLPGKRLGLYRFLPIYFCSGALMEFAMINWNAFGKVNFYKTYKKRVVHEAALKAIEKDETIDEVLSKINA